MQVLARFLEGRDGEPRGHERAQQAGLRLLAAAEIEGRGTPVHRDVFHRRLQGQRLAQALVGCREDDAQPTSAVAFAADVPSATTFPA